MKVKTIIVEWDGYFLLKKMNRVANKCEVTDKWIQYTERSFRNSSYELKGKRVKDLTHESLSTIVDRDRLIFRDWSLEEIAKILDQNNIRYEYGEVEQMTL